MKNACLVLMILCSGIAFGQKKYRILDSLTSESMPFVKVIPNNGSPRFSDIDGKFVLDSVSTSFQLRFQGYRDTTIQVTDLISDTVYMYSRVQVVDEVVARAGENPAHRIMDLVIANRKKNHPLENDAFTYKSYSKFIFDTDTSFRQQLMNSPLTDTSAMEAVEFLGSQYLFMLESASERSFIPPARDREDITAYKVSGFTHPAFSTFAQSLQSFNFYDNQFDLLGQSYVNPIALGGTKRYLFILEDTTVVGNDTTFTISFRPRLGKTFSGLKGTLFINTNGYAVEKVIAQPYKDSTGTEVKIVQEYAFIDNTKWFPVSLSTQVEMKSAAISAGATSGYLEGKGNTYIRDIRINPDDQKKRGFGNVALATDVGAENASTEEWNAVRRDSLTEMEQNTYVRWDSIVKENNLDKKLTGLMALTTGRVRMGPVALPLTRIIDFNRYEGYRLGLGLETSDLLMKNIMVGGYFGWGTRDKDWKYGGYLTFYLNRRRGLQIDLRYQQDLLHRGSNEMEQQGWNLNSTEGYQRIFRTYMDKQRLAELQLSYSPLGNMTIHLSGNYQRLELTKGYTYTPIDTTVYTANRMDFAETSIEWHWNIRERVMLLGDMRVSKGTKFPKIIAKVTKGWAGVGEAQTDYMRLYLRINEDLKSLRFGTLNLSLQLSQTIGDVPLALKQVVIGTRQDWTVTVLNTFETVFPGEFYHDKQAAFFMRYTFPAIRTKAKWNEPQFALHHAIGYGEFAGRTEHNQSFQSMDKGLYEAGIILNGMLTFNTYRLGLGAFYRYGYYSDTNALKNLVPKICLTIALNN